MMKLYSQQNQVYPNKNIMADLCVGVDFPKDFITTIRTIYKQLFRILAHIYHGHYDRILHLSSEAHLNTLFAHFICFSKEFDLIEKKDTVPMMEFITILESSNRI